jgi:hypothetical protein
MQLTGGIYIKLSRISNPFRTIREISIRKIILHLSHDNGGNANNANNAGRNCFHNHPFSRLIGKFLKGDALVQKIDPPVHLSTSALFIYLCQKPPYETGNCRRHRACRPGNPQSS